MKQKHIALYAILLTVFFVGCKEADQAPTTDPCKKLHAEDYSGQPRDGYLNIFAADAFAASFRNNKDKGRVSINDQPTNQEDSRAMWISLDQLKKYVWQIEDTLCKSGCDIKKLGLGVHIYLAKYPDETTITALGADPKLAHHQTIFLTATFKGNAGQNVDFDPYFPDVQNGKPTSLAKFLEQNPRKDTGSLQLGIAKESTDGKATEPGVNNHFAQSPPPPGAGSFPTSPD